MKRGLKRVLTAVLAAGLIAAAAAAPLSGWAAAANADPEYHAPPLETMKSTLSNSLKDWAGLFSVSEADPGVRYQWTNAPQNVRLGSPSLLKADGLHLIFDGFSSKAGMNASMALTLGLSAVNSDYVTDTDYNTMAQLPFVLVLDTVAGNLTAYGSKTFTSANTGEIVTELVTGSDALKGAALEDKTWEVRLDAVDAAAYKVSVNGVEARLPVDKIVGTGSRLDLDACAFVLNTWGNNNSFSVNLRSLHGGEAACADRLGPQDLARATAVVGQIKAIGAIGANSRPAVETARKGYDALPSTLQTLVTNYRTLTLAETVLPVTESIGRLGNVTLDSASAVEEAEKKYAGLTDEEKQLVSNYDAFIKAKTQLLKLQFAAGLTTAAPKAPTRRPTAARPTQASSEPTQPDPTETTAEPEATTTGTAGTTPTSAKPTVAPSQTGGSAGTLAVIVVGAVLLAGMGGAAALILLRRRKAAGQ